MGVRVAGISKDFATASALRDVTLDVRAGELMALLGPSGSGKTTLLRVIAGLEQADAGQIFFGDVDATRLRVQHRGIGFVFQHYALFRHLTVFDNIAYGLRVRPRRSRPSAGAIRARVLELLDLVQLSNLEKRFPAQLSGGQRQRVALARALATEPRVLLLDEPFGALDAKVRKDLRDWLRGIHERTGKTTIFVTHDQEEATELADRIAILNEGRIEQVGTPDDLQEHPASAYVMSFLGETARFKAHVEDGVAVIDGHMTRVAIPDQARGAIDLYCRPWDLRLVAAGAGDVAGTVRRVRHSRGLTHIEVEAASVGLIGIEVPGSLRFRVGDAIGIVIEHAHFFSTSSR